MKKDRILNSEFRSQKTARSEHTRVVRRPTLGRRLRSSAALPYSGGGQHTRVLDWHALPVQWASNPVQVSPT
jgi:hypothetical protein